jgi:hypothetical protein
MAHAFPCRRTRYVLLVGVIKFQQAGWGSPVPYDWIVTLYFALGFDEKAPSHLILTLMPMDDFLPREHALSHCCASIILWLGHCS